MLAGCLPFRGMACGLTSGARGSSFHLIVLNNPFNVMATKVNPLADRVLVEAAPAEETTKGGIIIPDTAKEKPQRGKIIAVGTGRVADDGKVTPLSVKVGDSILYGKYSGTELSLEGKDYLIMRESDIYAVLN